MPVATTNPSPLPAATSVPLYAMFVLSATGASSRSSGAAVFSTGSDSPVSAASSVRSRTASESRTSAGTTEPVWSTTRSPGTSRSAPTSRGLPSRTTVAVGAAIRFSAAIARSARYSCTKPSTAFRTTITAMAIVSAASPITPATTAATMSTMIMKSRNWSTIMAATDLRGFSLSALRP